MIFVDFRGRSELILFIDRDQTQIEPFLPRHNVVVGRTDLERVISLPVRLFVFWDIMVSQGQNSDSFCTIGCVYINIRTGEASAASRRYLDDDDSVSVWCVWVAL